ncbi:hypothetical protein DFP73DRAFT_554295 [Morchella snyderi]|nr:hypothetical protein DFP73DRAFT_554295 [Morchella snyderi]
MLFCQLCRYSYIKSLFSVHVPLRCSYAIAAYSRPSSDSFRASPPTHVQRSPPRAKDLGASSFSRKSRPTHQRINMKDPLKVSDLVRRRLETKDENSAVSLAREASRTMDTVVSWNVIIQYYLRNGRIKHAFQAYNEMKKRKILPDSHTFTLILNGLSENTHFGQTLSRALQVYNSLSNPKSPVKPNIFHTNAILRVCSRAEDLDSMWAIVGGLPTKGPDAPNTQTYTILLNGIQSTKAVTTDVEDGRRVWAGVLSKWIKGQLWIDEALACAMGRVLLRGEREADWKEVFTLCEQVYGIESLVPKDAIKPHTKDTIFSGQTNQRFPLVPVGGGSPPIEPKVPAPFDPNAETTFSPIAKPYPTSTRPKPGNETLSLILQACTNLGDPITAYKYWSILTAAPYKVKPDLVNFHDYLRILRRERLGPEALKLVKSMDVTPTAKTFYIALSSCKRHGRSTAFSSAQALLDLMINKWQIPVDVKVWNMFLQVSIKTGDPANVKQALRRVDDEVDLELELVRRRKSPMLVERCLEMARTLISVMDVLMNSDGKLAKEATWGHGERASFEKRRKELGALVTRFGAGAKRRAYRIEMEGEDYA